MPFASSDAARFTDAKGQPCPVFAGPVKENNIGWHQGKDSDIPACTYDSFENGTEPAALELRWRVVVPEDGNYDVVAMGYSVGAFGRVLSRGGWKGSYYTKVKVDVDASSSSCGGDWSQDLANAKVDGPWEREAPFSGWVQIPDIQVYGCRGQDVLELRVRLIGETNRGQVDVDWFGFSAQRDDEMNKIFALKPRTKA
jgi:hypothetical protein